MPYEAFIKAIKALPSESYLKLSEYVNFLTYKFSSDKASSEPEPEKGKRKIGGLKGSLKYMADDFDASLDDFKEYM